MAYKIDPETTVGHIHLKVSDLDQSIDFYTRVLGFEVMTQIGNKAAFLSAGGYHHHIGLNTWESAGTEPAPGRHPGLYHVAFLYPNRASLARAIAHLLDQGVSLDGASDHGVSEAVYLHDPDGNGIELYRDRPSSDWPRAADGSVSLVTKRLDLTDLLKEAEPTPV